MAGKKAKEPEGMSLEQAEDIVNTGAEKIKEIQAAMREAGQVISEALPKDKQVSLADCVNGFQNRVKVDGGLETQVAIGEGEDE